MSWYVLLGIGFIAGLVVGLKAPTFPKNEHFDCDERYHHMREKLSKELDACKAEIQRLVSGQ